MSETAFSIIKAVPVLPVLDLASAADFYEHKLGFDCVLYDDAAILTQGDLEVHLFLCADPMLPQNTSCYFNVNNIKALYDHCQMQGIVHPDGPLEAKPWGMYEFAVLDSDGNLLRFGEAYETGEA